MTIHAVTSLSFEQASPPGSPTTSAALAIENGLHNLCDTTFAEDASQLRTGTGPHVKATLRNLASARSAALGRSIMPPPPDTTPTTRRGPGHLGIIPR